MFKSAAMQLDEDKGGEGGKGEEVYAIEYENLID